MVEDRRKKLAALGAETLADAMLELATHVEVADDLVERLVATPSENIQRYKSKLAELKRRNHFISWRESAEYAYQLKMLLADLKSGVEDACAGVLLVAALFQADCDILEQCDDSDGIVGNVFQYDAKELFSFYASSCEEKAWLGEMIFDLCQKDEYGVRAILVDCAGQYLPESEIRDLIDKFQAAAGSEAEEYKKKYWMLCIQSLARQVRDAPLFEKVRLSDSSSPSSAAFIDVARVHLECGNVETALSWIQQVPAEERFHEHDRDQLLLEIYSRTGDKEKQSRVAWRIFRRKRSSRALSDLLTVIGSNQREAVITDEVAAILEGKALSYSNAKFLIEMGNIDAAEIYLLDRADQLNGDFYRRLLPLAEAMESSGHWLCASIIYRSLLDSILRRAQSKAYAHGVNYLKKLDEIAPSIRNWRDFETHKIYLDNLRRQHTRKRSFWPRYENG